MTQIDITPASNPSLGLTIHTQNGQSASAVNNPSDFPSTPPSATLPSGSKAVKVNITGTSGSVVRFANPS